MLPQLTYPFLNIYLHQTPCLAVETQWLSFANSADFRRGVSAALELGQQHEVRGWIADDRRLGAVRPKDLEWIHSHLLRALNELGLRRYALLTSEDTLNRLTIDRMYTQALADVSFELQRFADLDEARAWVGQ